TCHLGIDRAAYDKGALTRLSDPGDREKLDEAIKVFKERQQAGETLGFDPADLAAQRSWRLPTNVFLGVFAVGLLFALLGALVRQNLGLGVRVAVAGLVLAVVAGGVSAFWAPRQPVVKSVPLTEGEVAMYSCHPRLELFVDANSPHPAEKFGCTICHGGQGSATDFNLASHTPGDAQQKHQWEKNYAWESNHFWDFPM